MAIVDELVSVLGFDLRGQNKIKQYQTMMDRAEQSAHKFAAKIGLMGVAAAGASAMFAKGMHSFVSPIAEQLDVLAKTSSKVGLAAGSLQEFQFAASQMAGVTEQTVNMAMQRFSRRIGEAAAGSGELKGIIEELGIEIRNSDGSLKTSESLIDEFADAVANAGTEQEQLRIAFKMFDSEGAAMVNMLREGGQGIDKFRKEAEALGLVLTQDQLDVGTRFVDSMDMINRSMTAVRQRIALHIIPVFNDWQESMIDTYKRMRETGHIQAFENGVGRALGGALRAIGGFTSNIGWAFSRLTQYAGGVREFFDAIAIPAGILFARLFPLVTVFVLLILAIDDFITYMRGGESVLGNFIEALAAFLGADPSSVANALGNIGTAAATIAAVGMGFSLFVGALSALARVTGLMAIAKGVGALATAMGLASAPFWLAAAPVLALAAALGALVASGYALQNSDWYKAYEAGAREFGASIRSSLADTKAAYDEWGLAVGSAIRESLIEAGNSVVDWFADLPSRIIGAIGSIDLSGLIRWPSIPSPLKRLLGLGDDTSVSTNTTQTQPRAQIAPNPTRFGGGTSPVPANGMADLRARLENMNANIARITPESAVDATITDARVSNDNRQFPMQTSVVVNQTVNGPAQAPGAAARATGNAAAGAANSQRSRIASTPTTSGNGPQ